MFEYLWFKDAPHLRNATVHQLACDSAETEHLAAIAENAALHQLSAARLVNQGAELRRQAG